LIEENECGVYKPWESFLCFEEWALINDYSDDKILLRGTEENPDVGDYGPNNCRWGSKTDNYYDWKLHKELSS
jgi:hypothetical protein